MNASPVEDLFEEIGRGAVAVAGVDRGGNAARLRRGRGPPDLGRHSFSKLAKVTGALCSAQSPLMTSSTAKASRWNLVARRLTPPSAIFRPGDGSGLPPTGFLVRT